MGHDTVLPAVGGEFRNVQPAEFFSSDEYFELMDAITVVRKKLRANDDVLLKTSAQQDRGDEQLEKIAVATNAIQERLMELDGALFEE